MTAVFTPGAVRELLEDPTQFHIIQRWLDRGDGCAVYQNVELGHPELGHRKFMSYGSPAAQLEVDQPPERLPDIGTAINWRYRLEGVCRPTTEKGE